MYRTICRCTAYLLNVHRKRGVSHIISFIYPFRSTYVALVVFALGILLVKKKKIYRFPRLSKQKPFTTFRGSSNRTVVHACHWSYAAYYYYCYCYLRSGVPIRKPSAIPFDLSDMKMLRRHYSGEKKNRLVNLYITINMGFKINASAVPD